VGRGYHHYAVVRALNRLSHGNLFIFVKRAVGVLNTWQINYFDLFAVPLQIRSMYFYSGAGIISGLYINTSESVEQSRFAHVGGPKERVAFHQPY
jgi:hypothetical protein